MTQVVYHYHVHEIRGAPPSFAQHPALAAPTSTGQKMGWKGWLLIAILVWLFIL